MEYAIIGGSSDSDDLYRWVNTNSVQWVSPEWAGDNDQQQFQRTRRKNGNRT
jgi:hypothetical protein